MSELLQIDDLKTHFVLPRGELRAVNGVSFSLSAARTLGIVGESGSGKSTLARSIIRLLPGDLARAAGGRMMFAGRDLRQLSEAAMQRVRGREIAMIFQDPLTSLNPVMTIGRQIVQVLRQHTDLSAVEAKARAAELLAEVGIPDPRQRVREYAHRLSGDMRQRVVIAIALVCNPRLLIADEPTTALDVTVQAQILDLLRRLQERHQMAIILITHNLGVVAEVCDEVAVMYAGRIVEQGSVAQVLGRPRMRYTQALLQSMPRLDTPPHFRLPVIAGQPPNMIAIPSGCRFSPRCTYRVEQCGRQEPAEVDDGNGHRFLSWNPVGEAVHGR
jgi:oligopeptide/dipeptide ABC transporter ATP-binding protein